jgi:cytochrome P450
MVSASIDDFRLLSPEVLTEPHEYWRLLRLGSPVHEVDEGIGYTILTRYEDVSAALRDPDTFSSQLSRRFPAGMSAYEDSPEVGEVLKDACPYHDVLTFVDGDIHARHRRIARRPFTSRHVAELDEIIKATVAELVAELPRGEDFDLVSRLSVRLPIIVIGHILGVDPGHFDDVKRWADAQVARLGEPLDDDQENLRYARDLVDQHQFLFAQVRDRRRNPASDFLSDLVNSGEFSTDEELVLIAAQLIVAGAETTASLITTMLSLLLDDPALMQRGSANRDDAFAANAEEFDLDRTDGRKHLAFVQGVHMCVGANLARAEARLALEGLFNATTVIRRGDGTTHRRSSLTVRALENLPLVIE